MELKMEQYIGTKIIYGCKMTKGYAEKHLGHPIASKKNDDAKGYLVEYEGGYQSWSPKDVFEKAYKKIDGLTFGLAIEALKMGKRCARKGWNGKGIFIELQVPDEHSKMTHPYIFINTTGLQTDNPAAPKNCVPWLASQTDMLSDDWMIIE